MSPRDSLATLQELATLAGDRTPDGLSRLADRLDTMTRHQMEAVLLSALGALRSHYSTDAEWQAGALLLAEYMTNRDENGCPL